MLIARIGLTTAISFTLFSPAYTHPSVESDTTSSQREYPAWTMDFGIQGNFTLGSFLGSTVSISRYSDPTTKWMYGVSFNVSPESFNQEDNHFNADTQTTRTVRSGNNAMYSISFIAYRVHSLRSVGSFSLYAGWGPIIGGSVATADEAMESLNPAAMITIHDRLERTEYSWWIGLSCIAGVEWRCADGITLHADYGVQSTFAGSWVSVNESRTYPNSPGYRYAHSRSSTRFRLSGDSVRFGVSVFI